MVPQLSAALLEGISTATEDEEAVLAVVAVAPKALGMRRDDATASSALGILLKEDVDTVD